MGWFDKFKRPPQTHEEKLLALTTYDETKGRYPFYDRIAQFRKDENGDVYEKLGPYHSCLIPASLWSWYVDNERWPNSRHSFRWTGLAEGGQWPTQHAECSRCGDKRIVSMFIDIREANRDGWCVK